MEKKTIFVFKGILFDKDNRLLIDNRKEEILDAANGKWELPGGKIEFGESPEDTVKRELLEETGYKVKVNEIIPYSNVSIWDYSNCKQHTVIFFYNCELEDEDHLEIHDSKINKCRWITEAELNDYNFLPGNIEAIEIAIKNRIMKK